VIAHQEHLPVAQNGGKPVPEGALIGAAPAWIKAHSMGEFVYDHAWANAAERYGIRYYPTLVVGVPFSPVTGGRLLTAHGHSPWPIREALLEGLQAAAERTHGLHVLFNTAEAVGGLWLALTGWHWLRDGRGLMAAAGAATADLIVLVVGVAVLLFILQGLPGGRR
jgi:predicted N-acyltransferase